MQRLPSLLLVAASTLAIGACALRSADIAPAHVASADFAGWTCERLEEEIDFVQRHAARVAYTFDERAGANIVALGVGAVVFWPALLAMRPAGEDRLLLAQLKGRHEALATVYRAQACDGPAAASAAQAAPLPVRVGDRLAYEQRPSSGARASSAAPVRQIVLAVRELSRAALALEEVLVRPAGAAGTTETAGTAGTAPAQAAVWRSDRLGNLLESSTGPVWPQLVRAELELGSVLTGELLDSQDLRNRARVRGQVVAVGPQTVAGRRFDAAVIDLFGDAQGAGESSTRLDGVLVVDRRSGMLLRLDLYSSHPAFNFLRRLARIEAAAG